MCVGLHFVSAHGHRPRHHTESSSHLPPTLHRPSPRLLPRLLFLKTVARRPPYSRQAPLRSPASWPPGEVSTPPAAPSRAWPQESALVHSRQEARRQSSSARPKVQQASTMAHLPVLRPLARLQGWLLRRGRDSLSPQVFSFLPLASPSDARGPPGKRCPRQRHPL